MAPFRGGHIATFTHPRELSGDAPTAPGAVPGGAELVPCDRAGETVVRAGRGKAGPDHGVPGRSGEAARLAQPTGESDQVNSLRDVRSQVGQRIPVAALLRASAVPPCAALTVRGSCVPGESKRPRRLHTHPERLVSTERPGLVTRSGWEIGRSAGLLMDTASREILRDEIE